ncbi:replication initiator protein A [Clostridium sp. AF50-3]|uniref:replication initiator protein A n=1 Tax=Clostridium sp. AF50-3 TaxID=2293021 RepID=UPI00269CF912
MGKQIQFDYYYGIEAEQFSFYRVPRLLIKDERFKGLSSDAKLLYGLMLDRMSLSMKNGWLDEENRAISFILLIMSWRIWDVQKQPVLRL